MERVRLLPVYEGSLRERDKMFNKRASVLMGISAIMLGALLLVASDAMEILTQYFRPISDNIVDFFAAIGTQSAGMPTVLNVSAIFLMTVIGALLYVLHQGDQINTAREGH